MSWPVDLLREAIRVHPDLAHLFEEVLPWRSDLMPGSDVTTVDEDDLKEFGQYSESSLLDRYKDAEDHNRHASPPFPGVQAPPSE